MKLVLRPKLQQLEQLQVLLRGNNEHVHRWYSLEYESVTRVNEC